jgi:hypothetical protein
VLPSLNSALISQVSRMVAKYIADQRDRYLPRAIPLSPEQRTDMSDFFSPELLDSARLLVLQGERVPNPDFYPMLRSVGLTGLPDQATMAAITFGNVVVSHGPFSRGVLFHELVHVEQYRQLGIDRFAELYVRGFLAGGGYDGIPLEVNAHILGAQYEAGELPAFSVADEVRKWIAEGKF